MEDDVKERNRFLTNLQKWLPNDKFLVALKETIAYYNVMVKCKKGESARLTFRKNMYNTVSSYVTSNQNEKIFSFILIALQASMLSKVNF